MRVKDLLFLGVIGLASFSLEGAAFAATAVDDQLANARDAIAAKDFKAAVKALDAAEAGAPGAETVLPARTLARIYFYRGVAEHLQGDKKGKAIEYWRQTLVFDNGFKWEVEVLKADDPETLFEALRSEVRSRSKRDVGVPEKVGAAQLFVDGQRRATGDTVLEGTHLAQITCPDGKTHGTWTDFSKPVKWFALCPGGVDTSVVVADSAATDEWSEFGPSFGSPVAGGEALLDVPFTEEGAETAETPAPSAPAPVAEAPAPVAETPAPVAATPVVAPTVAATPTPPPSAPIVSAADDFDVPAISLASGPDEPEPTIAPVAPPVVAVAPVASKPPEPKAVEPVKERTPEPEPVAELKPPKTRGEGPGAGVFLLAGGGALLAGGAVSNFVLVNPAYARVEAAREDPASVTRKEADALSSQFSTWRGVTLGLLGGGAALAGVSVALDSSLTPYVTPGTIGLRGRF